MRESHQHILLIDDDPDMHDVVQLILSSAGYRVTCCSTTTSGAKVMLSDPPDALLLDIMLSTPTEGLDFATRLRADPHWATLPIIMVSSAPPDLRAADDQSTGAGLAQLFLSKPLNAKELRAAVERVLTERTQA